MRVCFISPYPPQRHGVAGYTQDLIHALRENDPGLKIFVISHVHPGPEAVDDIHVIRILERRSPFYFAVVLPHVLRVRPDVVHIQHEYYAFGGATNISLALLTILLRLCSITTVVTMHEVYPQPELSGRSRWKALARYLLFKTQTFLICRCSAHTIVHTNLSKTTLEQEFSARHVVVIPHGTRTRVPRLSSDEAKKALHLEGRKVAMSFGSLRPGKGLEYAIESMAIVTNRLPEAVLILAGGLAPGVRGYLEQLSNLSHRLGVFDSVVFTGRYVEKEELPLYFSAADAIILSYLGQFRSGSGVLHLAASYGKPVVASDVGEAAEVLRRCEGGILVPQADGPALANALTKLLLNEPMRIRMGQSLRAYMVDRSSWEGIARETLKIYDSLVLKNKRV